MRLISSLNFLIPAFNNSHLKQSESLAWSQLCWDVLLFLAVIAIISVVWSQWLGPVLQIIDPIGPHFLSQFSKCFFSFIFRYSTASKAFSKLLVFIKCFQSGTELQTVSFLLLSLCTCNIQRWYLWKYPTCLGKKNYWLQPDFISHFASWNVLGRFLRT